MIEQIRKSTHYPETKFELHGIIGFFTLTLKANFVRVMVYGGQLLNILLIYVVLRQI